MNLNSVLIGSEDPRRLADYYTRLFGPPKWDDGGYSTWLLGSGALTIGAHDQVQGRNAHPGRIIWNLESEDVEGDFARLREAGAIVVREPYAMEGGDDRGERIATLADPDDNLFQLISPMPLG